MGIDIVMFIIIVCWKWISNVSAQRKKPSQEVLQIKLKLRSFIFNAQSLVGNFKEIQRKYIP